MAVDAVWREPLSGRFPLLTGTFTGISALKGHFHAGEMPPTHSPWVLYERNASDLEQGTNRELTGA